MSLSPILPIDFYGFTINSDSTLSAAFMFFVTEYIRADFIL